MLVDTHNHTCHFSPDAKMTADELIAAAAGAGPSSVAVTEHYEIDNRDENDNIHTFDLDEYCRAFSRWSAGSSGVGLLMGIEFGYQSHTAGEITATASYLPFDVVILSNHRFRGIDVALGSEAYLVDRITRHREYIGKMAEMAQKVTDYDIIGHYNYIDRYNADKNEDVFYDDCPKEFDELFEVMIAHDRALEINTRIIDARIKKGSPFVFPDRRILERYISMGGRLISLGSDSHVPDTVGILFRETSEYLRSFNIGEAAYYKKREVMTTPLY